MHNRNAGFCLSFLLQVAVFVAATSDVAAQQLLTHDAVHPDGYRYYYTYYLSPGGAEIKQGVYEKWRAGLLTLREYYQNNLLNGTSTTFNINGKPSTVRNYVDGQLEGEATDYWSISGKPSFVRTYVNGVLQGPYRMFTYSGLNKEVGEYVDDVKFRKEVWSYWGENLVPIPAEGTPLFSHSVITGNLATYTSWHKNGTMMEYSEYMDGQLNGVDKKWNPDGTPIDETHYVNGLQHGPYFAWNNHPDGTHLVRAWQYEYGQMMSGTNWFYNWSPPINQAKWTLEEVIEEPVDGSGQRDGNYKEWWPNGQIRKITAYAHGLRHGLRQTWWKNGSQASSYPYRDGKVEGTAYDWSEANVDSKGGVAVGSWSETSYVNDRRNGPATTWYSNGAKQEGVYANDAKCGPWILSIPEQNPWTGVIRTNRYTTDFGVCPSAAPAQPDPKAKDTSKRISGLVYDARTSNPIVGASIGGTTSASDGSFSISIGNADSYTLSCTKPGYDRFVTTLNMAGTQSRSLTIRLKRTVSTKVPSVTSVEPVQTGVYFYGFSVPSEYVAHVQWNGLEPGSVIFEVAGTQIDARLTADGATATLNMGGLPFIPSADSKKNRIKVIARSKTGEQSLPEYVYPAVIPLPTWAQSLGPFLSSKSQNVFTYAGKAKWPQKPIKMSIDPESLGSIGWAAWSLFPIVGGRVFGIPPSQFFLDTEFKSDGKGSLAAGGTTAFMVSDGSIAVKLGGKGYALFKPKFGMELQKASVLIGCEGSVTNGVGVITVIPALERAVYLPVVGRPLSWFNNLARIEAKIYAGFDLEFPVWAKQAELAFASANLKAKEGITLGLVGEVKGEIRGELGGDGELVFYFQTPPVGGERYLIKAEAKLGGQLLLQVWSYQKRFAFEHWWVNEWTETPQTRSLRRPEIINRSYELDGPGFVPISAKSFASPNYNSFVANRAAVRPLSLSAASGSSETVLIRNVYPYCDPAIAALDNRLAVVYVTFNTNQPAVRATDIALTYSAAGGQYSVPAVVTNDTSADFSPAAAFADSNTVVVAWQRVKDANFSETNDIPDMAKAMEIAWAAYNVEASKWGPVHSLTDNAYLDHSPLLSRSPDGTLLLSWVANSGNEMIGTTNAADRIWYSFWDAAASAFAEPTGMTRDLVACSDYRIANYGQRALLAYSQDLDGVLFSTNAAGQFVGSSDQEIFVQPIQGPNWFDPIRITTNNVADSSPTPRFDSSGKEHLVWLSGSNLVMRSGLESGTQSLVRESSDWIQNFRTISRGDDRVVLIWQGVETNGMDLYYRSYDPVADSWSEDRRLTQDPPAEGDFEGVFAASNRLSLVYVKKDFSTTNTDLCLLNRSLTLDLAIAPNGLRCDPASPVPGQPVTILCNVTNRGDLPVSSLTASFYLGTTNAVPLATLSLSNTVLRAGAATDLVWRWTAPADTNTTPLVAVVKPGGLLSETDLANNVASLSLFLPDLEILNTRIDRGVEGRADAVAVIRNRGAVLATNLFVRFDAESRLLGVKQVPDVLPGNIIEAAQSFSPELDFTNAAGSVAITVDPDNLVAESDKTNNKGEIFAFMREDTNENGLPDWWEQFYFGKLVDAADDADGDGFSNLQEFWTQTSPTDGTDRFQVQASPPVQGGTNLTLRWNLPPGWQYSVYMATNVVPTNGWRLVGAGVATDDAVTFTNRPYFPQQFYKVQISP